MSAEDQIYILNRVADNIKLRNRSFQSSSDFYIEYLIGLQQCNPSYVQAVSVAGDVFCHNVAEFSCKSIYNNEYNQLLHLMNIGFRILGLLCFHDGSNDFPKIYESVNSYTKYISNRNHAEKIYIIFYDFAVKRFTAYAAQDDKDLTPIRLNFCNDLPPYNIIQCHIKVDDVFACMGLESSASLSESISNRLLNTLSSAMTVLHNEVNKNKQNILLSTKFPDVMNLVYFLPQTTISHKGKVFSQVQLSGVIISRGYFPLGMSSKHVVQAFNRDIAKTLSHVLSISDSLESREKYQKVQLPFQIRFTHPESSMLTEPFRDFVFPDDVIRDVVFGMGECISINRCQLDRSASECSSELIPDDTNAPEEEDSLQQIIDKNSESNVATGDISELIPDDTNAPEEEDSLQQIIDKNSESNVATGDISESTPKDEKPDSKKFEDKQSYGLISKLSFFFICSCLVLLLSLIVKNMI